MTAADALAGILHLHPGRAAPNICSSRPALAGPLTHGRPVAGVPDLLATVYALCGDAHRLVSRLAIAAARGRAIEGGPAHAHSLRLDTLREHLRRIWLDWSPALAGRNTAAADLVALRDCPLLRRGDTAGDVVAASRAWIAVHMLDTPAGDWLDAWEADPAPWLEHWCQRCDTLPARLLAGCREPAARLAGRPLPLRVHGDATALAAIAAAMRGHAGFAQAPEFGPQRCETGPWARLADAGWARHDNAWLRLGARLAEAVRLSLPDASDRCGTRWLRHGALTLGGDEGLAWCEMARGLLVHRVVVDDRGAGPPRIAEYDVLAPTEWNFHPRGPVAQWLAALPIDGDDAPVRMLTAAFDPCVAVRIERRPAPDLEPGDA